MAPPIRNVADAEPGQVNVTPARVLRKLAIRKLKVRGYVPTRRGR